MKKLRPQVSADLVEQVKGEFKSFEEGLLELINMSEHSNHRRKTMSDKLIAFLKAETSLKNEKAALEKENKELTIRLCEMNGLKEKHALLMGKYDNLSDRHCDLSEKYCDSSDEISKLKSKLKDWDELREKYNREAHKREMLELKYKQLECDAKVKDAAELSDKIAVLLDLDKDMLGKSQSITVRVEAGQILVDLDGCMPLVKFTN